MSDVQVPNLPTRSDDAHKGDVGRVLVIAGSRGMTGAAVLTARGALRGGAGLVKLAVPETCLKTAGSLLVCALTMAGSDPGNGSFCADAVLDLAPECIWSDVVAVGPGLGRSDETGEFVRKIVPEVDRPLVIDADGLFHLATDLKILDKRSKPTIITPHPGEMANMTASTIDSVQSNRSNVATDFAGEHGVVCVLKGEGTIVSDGSRVYTNTSGNSGMATGGTGDVLTGLIAALVAQGMDAFDASVLGVYLHGVAGDIAARKLGIHSMLATDLVDCLPDAFLSHGSA